MNNEVNYSRSNAYYDEMQRRKRKKLIAYATIAVVIIAIICAVVFGGFLSPMRVDGDSMSPTLIHSQTIFVQKLLYKIVRNDIVILDTPDSGVRVVKRVIGMPGDTLKTELGKLYINGELAIKNYFHYNNGSIRDIKITLGNNEYFVLGDNASVSRDSRIFGAVDKDLIIGKCIIISGAPHKA